MSSEWSKESLLSGPNSMWRYAPALPVRDAKSIVSLGEGMTPLLRARRVEMSIGGENLWIKDEGRNPTGSFEARGFSCAISMCVERDVREISVLLAGDAASALAAYAAAAGIAVQLSLPADTSQSVYAECSAYGAKITLTENPDTNPDPLKDDRIEGAKTIGYEIAEQLGWTLPDAVVCPAACIPAIERAFSEIVSLGWVKNTQPKIFSCDAVTGRTRTDAALQLASEEGIFASPEGAAGIALATELIHNKSLPPGHRIVVVNPASGLRYTGVCAARFPRTAVGQTDKLGGLITPR